MDDFKDVFFNDYVNVISEGFDNIFNDMDVIASIDIMGLYLQAINFVRVVFGL